MVVRIMVMVPLYAVASLISLFSVEAAFFIDAIRDIYEVSFDGISLSAHLIVGVHIQVSALSQPCIAEFF